MGHWPIGYSKFLKLLSPRLLRGSESSDSPIHWSLQFSSEPQHVVLYNILKQYPRAQVCLAAWPCASAASAPLHCMWHKIHWHSLYELYVVVWAMYCMAAWHACIQSRCFKASWNGSWVWASDSEGEWDRLKLSGLTHALPCRAMPPCTDTAESFLQIATQLHWYCMTSRCRSTCTTCQYLIQYLKVLVEITWSRIFKWISSLMDSWSSYRTRRTPYGPYRHHTVNSNLYCYTVTHPQSFSDSFTVLEIQSSDWAGSTEGFAELLCQSMFQYVLCDTCVTTHVTKYVDHSMWRSMSEKE